MAVGLRVSNVNEDKEPTRYFSKKQETKVAKTLDGRVQANSGATDFKKGDVVIPKLMLLECKTKTSHSESISVKKEWITKNKQESLFMGLPYQSVCFSFGPDEPNYFIIDEYMMSEFIQYLKEKHNI